MIAVCQRAEIKSWIKEDMKTAQWKEYIKDSFVLQVLSAQKSWREMIEYAGKQAKTRNSPKVDILGNIEKAVQKYLKKSPEQDILKAKAYAWLKHIQEYPPTDAWWFPHKAIEVAHKAFCLSGKIKTFKKYLSKPSRRNKLKSIFPGAVLCFFFAFDVLVQ